MSDNELIAEFMGKSVYPEKIPTTKNKRGWKYSRPWKGEHCDYSTYEIKYDTSWNWLMPVVGKIYSMYDPDYEKGKYYNVGFAHELFDLSLGTPINEVYLEVVKSIKWYNSVTPNRGSAD